jgi:hypothetical protein
MSVACDRSRQARTHLIIEDFERRGPSEPGGMNSTTCSSMVLSELFTAAFRQWLRPSQDRDIPNSGPFALHAPQANIGR